MSDEIKVGDTVYRIKTFGDIGPFDLFKVVRKSECSGNRAWPRPRCRECSGHTYTTADGITRCGVGLIKYKPLKLKLTTRRLRT